MSSPIQPTVAACVFRLLVLFLFAICPIFPVGLAHAGEVFEEAVEAWLADDDEASLPVLAQLASDGNGDAQLLLGRIADRPGAYSPYMASLDRKKRNALLKAPGGLSGKSWLGVIAGENDIASAHVKAKDVKNGTPGIAELILLGEIGPSVEYMSRQINQGNNQDILQLSRIGSSTNGAQFFEWLAAFNAAILGEPVASPTARNTIEEFDAELARYDLRALTVLSMFDDYLSAVAKRRFAVARGVADELRTGFNFDLINDPTKTLSLTAAAVVLMNSEHTKPLVSLCKQECPASVAACVTTLFGAVGGYLGLLSLQTPVEKYIPSQRYFESRRHQADLLRVAYNTLEEKGWETPPGTLDRRLKGKIDQCIADKALASSAYAG